MNYSFEEIKSRVEGLSTFKGWKDGYYLIAIRNAKDAFNKFDDIGVIVRVDNAPKELKRVSLTTNAGKNGLLNYKSYNKLGCAILKSNWMVYDSHRLGKHKGKYSAFRQDKPFPYFRDSDMDKLAEEVGKEYNDIIYANIHKAGKNSKLIDGWSLACIVFNIEDEYNYWMNELKGVSTVSLIILKSW